MISKCTICGRQCWTCRACNNRTYCEFCNHCNLHGQEPPAPEISGRRAGARTAVRGHGRVPDEAWLERGVSVRVRSAGLAGAIWKGVRTPDGSICATNPREAGQVLRWPHDANRTRHIGPQSDGLGTGNWRLNGPQL